MSVLIFHEVRVTGRLVRLSVKLDMQRATARCICQGESLLLGSFRIICALQVQFALVHFAVDHFAVVHFAVAFEHLLEDSSSRCANPRCSALLADFMIDAEFGHLQANGEGKPLILQFVVELFKAVEFECTR